MPPGTSYKIKTMVIMTTILFYSLKSMCQVTQDCTYRTQLDKIDHFLDSVTAWNWMNHYQQYIDSVSNGLTKFDPNILPEPQESFNRRYIQKVLDITGCIGERVFIGINDKQKMVAILGGIDSCGHTLYISSDGLKTQSVNNDGGKGLVEIGQFP